MDQTYKCPVCNSEDVRVITTVAYLPTQEGVVVMGEIIKEGSDFAGCNDCDWEGRMHMLVLSPAKEEVTMAKNTQGVGRARVILDAYMAMPRMADTIEEATIEEATIDLICDLMHLADAEGLDAAAIVRMATNNHKGEK